MPRRATGTYKFKKRDGTIGIAQNPSDIRPIVRMSWTFVGPERFDLDRLTIKSLKEKSPFYITRVYRNHPRDLHWIIEIIDRYCQRCECWWSSDINTWRSLFFSLDDEWCLNGLTLGHYAKHG